jgi:hypothetical protein
VRVKGGEGILRHLCREIMFGTDSISLAALAVLLGEVESDLEDTFCARAARAVDGFSNEDIWAFLAIMQHPEDMYIEREWRSTCFFDIKLLVKPHWVELRSILGIDEERVYGAISECVSRRIFLPDNASGRGAGTDDLAMSIFIATEDTARYFRLLGRATQIAEPQLYGVVAPLNFESADAFCAHRPDNSSENQHGSSQ